MDDNQNPFADLLPNKNTKTINTQNPFADLLPSQNEDVVDKISRMAQQNVIFPKTYPDIKQIPTFLGTMPSRVPQLESGTPENKELIDQLINFAAGNPGMEVTSALPTAIEKSGGNIFSRARKNLSPLEEKLSESKLAYEANEEALNQSKAEAEQAGFSSNPNKLLGQTNKLKQQLLENQPQKPSNLPISSSQESARNLESATNNHQIQTQKLEDIEDQLSQHLNEGASHDVRVARLAKRDLENLKQEGTSKYNEVEKDVAHQGIVLNNTRSAKEINDDLLELVTKDKDTQLTSPDAKKLLDELSNLNKGEVIPASEYMSAIKSVKGYMRDAYKKAYEPGINEEKRQFFKRQADQASEKLEEMNKILEENIGNENFQKLQDANIYWKKIIIPLWSEPLYWKIINKERMSSNIASELRGGAPGSGIEIIRNVIKNNPEAVKNVVGQKFAKNPTALKNPNELFSEYVDQMPEVKRLLNNHSAQEEMVNHSKDMMNNAKQKHDITLENEKNAFKEAEKEKTSIESNKVKRKKLEDEIKLRDKHIKVLQEKTKKKNISLKEKIKVENELKDEMNKRSSARKKLGLVLKIIGYTVLPYGGYKIGSMLSHLGSGENK